MTSPTLGEKEGTMPGVKTYGVGRTPIGSPGCKCKASPDGGIAKLHHRCRAHYRWWYFDKRDCNCGHPLADHNRCGDCGAAESANCGCDVPGGS